MYAEGITSSGCTCCNWLIASYIIWPIVGLVCFALYWNGSWGWLDRGYWQELQRAADTTYPFNTTKLVEKEAREAERPSKKAGAVSPE